MTTSRSRVLTQVQGHWQHEKCSSNIDNTTLGVVRYDNEPYSQRLSARVGFLRGKIDAATSAGIYLVGLSEKNDLGWSFRQMRAGLVDTILKITQIGGYFGGYFVVKHAHF